MKNLDTNPNFAVRAMVLGAVRTYGVQANSPRLALRHAKYVLKNTVDKNAVILNTKPLGV